MSPSTSSMGIRRGRGGRCRCGLESVRRGATAVGPGLCIGLIAALPGCKGREPEPRPHGRGDHGGGLRLDGRQRDETLFSVLYPPSIRHVSLWRAQLLRLSLLLAHHAAGRLGVEWRQGSAGLSRARPAGCCRRSLAFVFFPLFIDVQLGLGQANVGIAGLFGLAMGAVSRGWATPAALVAVVGAGVKLVLGAGRRFSGRGAGGRSLSRPASAWSWRA